MVRFAPCLSPRADTSPMSTPAPAAPAAALVPFYQLYRRSSCVSRCSAPPLTARRLGNALFEALDELIQSGHINPQLALKVLNQVGAAPWASRPARTSADATGPV